MCPTSLFGKILVVFRLGAKIAVRGVTLGMATLRHAHERIIGTRIAAIQKKQLPTTLEVGVKTAGVAALYSTTGAGAAQQRELDNCAPRQAQVKHTPPALERHLLTASVWCNVLTPRQELALCKQRELQICTPRRSQVPTALERYRLSKRW